MESVGAVKELCRVTVSTISTDRVALKTILMSSHILSIWQSVYGV